jgi:hypothetical protein
MLGKYLNLEAKNAMLKFEILNVVIVHLVDKESLDRDASEMIKTVGVDTVNMREIEKQDKIRLKEIKIEEKRRVEEITTRKINQTKRDRNANARKKKS